MQDAGCTWFLQRRMSCFFTGCKRNSPHRRRTYSCELQRYPCPVLCHTPDSAVSEAPGVTDAAVYPNPTWVDCSACHTTSMTHGVFTGSPSACTTCHDTTQGAVVGIIPTPAQACYQCHGGTGTAVPPALQKSASTLAALATGYHGSSVVTALFNASASDLVVNMDASSSACVSGSTCTTPLSYSWDCDGTTTAPPAMTTTSSCSYTAAGTYTITLTVTDSASHSASKAVQMTVTAPIVAPTPGGSMSACTNLGVTFTDASTTGSTVTLFWGDGSFTSKAASSVFTHKYTRAGAYSVNQKVVSPTGQMTMKSPAYSANCVAGSANITGTVKSFLGTNLSSVIVYAKATVNAKLVTYLAITNSTGGFTILNPATPDAGGTYILTFIKSGYTFAPKPGVAIGTSVGTINAILPITN